MCTWTPPSHTVVLTAALRCYQSSTSVPLVFQQRVVFQWSVLGSSCERKERRVREGLFSAQKLGGHLNDDDHLLALSAMSLYLRAELVNRKSFHAKVTSQLVQVHCCTHLYPAYDYTCDLCRQLQPIGVFSARAADHGHLQTDI